MRGASPAFKKAAAVAVAAVVLLAGLLVVPRLLGASQEQSEAAADSTGPAGDSMSGLRVMGNRIVNALGAPVRLVGFNVSGSEYACLSGWGFFDQPAPDSARMTEARVAQMAAWSGANTVRVPLNEQCWLGLGVDPAFGGPNYQDAIRDFVDLLRAQGFAVVLDLHRSAPGDARSEFQEQMPDRDHSLEFWRQVATAYKDDTAVVFDVFNEPWPLGETSDGAWRCWRDGGCPMESRNGGGQYQTVGMTELVEVIRSTGAANIIALGGIAWAEVLDQWLEYRPDDPLDNLVASFHNYAFNRICRDASCYDTVLARVAERVPLYAGEVGPDADVAGDAPCPPSAVGDTGFSDGLLDWLDRHGASWTAWSWNAWGDCYALIADPEGTPTPIWGQQIRTRLAALGQ
ncbi:glycoside hydrolase family 5 protein [Geodermatophilus sp. SYSU D00705]